MTILEIAVQDVSGAYSAVQSGAQRVELCQALGTGGLTPSIGSIEQVVDAIGGTQVAVLVRPRPGGFVYEREEIELVSRDIVAAVSLGVGGVVVGALTHEGFIDYEALRRWKDAAGAADVVFHRAIDTLPEPETALEGIIEAGVSRILTSGGAVRSIDGIATIARLVEHSGDRVEIMAGGGVTPDVIPAFVGVGVSAVHLSARRSSASLAPSGPGGGASDYDVTDGEIVLAAAAALAQAQGGQK